MSQDKKNEKIKNLNNNLGKLIDKSKSFEDQIQSLKKRRSKRVSFYERF